MDLNNLDDLILLGAVVCLQGCAYYLKYMRRRRRRGRRWWVRPVNRERAGQGFHHNLFRTLRTTDHEEFYDFVRMLPDQFQNLLALVEPYIKNPVQVPGKGRRPLSAELKLALTLQYLAHGDSRRSKSWEYRIGRSTVHAVVKRVCEAIVLGLRERYLPAPEDDDWVRFSEEYFHRWQFPNCIGAIDGKHIRIESPPKSGSQYFNYKKYFSIILMAMCDANYRFVWVDIGQYGSFGDRNIWAHCELGKALRENTLNIPPPRELPGTDVQLNHVIIGDAAFPLSLNLLRPYGGKRRLTLEERLFNYRLSRARNTIENAFGILAARWRVLHSTICCTPENATTLTMCLVLLHNFIMTDENYTPMHRRKYCPPHYVDREDSDGNMMPGAWRLQREQSALWRDITMMGSNNYEQKVAAQRDVLKAYFCSDTGAAQVPWQFTRVLRDHRVNLAE